VAQSVEAPRYKPATSEVSLT